MIAADLPVRPHPSARSEHGTPICIGGGTPGVGVNESGLLSRLNKCSDLENLVGSSLHRRVRWHHARHGPVAPR